jgi:SAM-dependent methyltransferase
MVTTPRSADVMELIRGRAAENGDDSYGDFVSAVSFDYYEQRVERLGFAGLGRVLDVGCGFGHWTAALAEVNDAVVGIDQSAPRLAVADEVARTMRLENVTLDLGDANRLPYPDASFRGVFCYSVFMFLERDRALADFHRVLEPGGRLYVCTSARGWWLRLWAESLRGNQTFRKAAFHGWARSGQGSPPHAVSTRRARRLLRDGWTNVEATLEGHVGVSAVQPPQSVYDGLWHGIESVVEFVAEKASDGEIVSRLEHDPVETADVLSVARRTLERATYEYVTPLGVHPQPRPALDLVNNCDPTVVRRALDRAGVVDRLKIMRMLYGDVTNGLDEDEARVGACVTFVQKHFFHHFAGQPMAEGVPVYDPVASLQLEYGRCGTTARFLVDLFECNGVSARLVGGACHTWAEVLCDGRWALADANLYPPGVLPRDAVGRLLTLEEAIARPDLLNRVPSYVNYHYEFIDAFLDAYPETKPDLEHLLVRPLLPSTGYFGADFYSGEDRAVGSVQRYRKTGSPDQWLADPLFGWGSLDAETIQGPGLPLEQRPPQVRHVSVEGGSLTWSPVTGAEGEPAHYRVVSSTQSRGWEYDALPVGCTFKLEGEAVTVEEPRVSLRDARLGGSFVTIVAENPAWAAREIFYLPSREFFVR